MKNLIRKTREFKQGHPFILMNLICVFTVALITVIYLINFNLSDDIDDHRWESYVSNHGLIFEDEAFEKAVFKQLGFSSSKMNKDYIKEITYLEIIDDSQVENLSDLKFFTSLEYLKIVNCNVSDISPIVNLKNLIVLDLSGNGISDVTPLGEIKKLQALAIRENKINNADALGKIQHLINLDISFNKIKSVDFIENNKNIEILNAGHNKISTLKSLNKLKYLTDLLLDTNKIEDIDFMKNNKTIKVLNISHNHVKDLSPLLTCKAFEELRLYGVKYVDLSPLQKIESFNSIYLSKYFDRSQIDFLIGNFKNADRFSKVYLIEKYRGFKADV
ncbi:MAG: leucine-rich repeat domain-containing protein [Clostridiales bacterium]|nr:leucine-rich repeat domain-containing protein [Clostridiales bacterium]